MNTPDGIYVDYAIHVWQGRKGRGHEDPSANSRALNVQPQRTASTHMSKNDTNSASSHIPEDYALILAFISIRSQNRTVVMQGHLLKC